MEKDISYLDLVLSENESLRRRVRYLEKFILQNGLSLPSDSVLENRFKMLQSSIHEVGFSVRLRNCLMIPGIKTIEELLDWNPQSLKKIRGFGDYCLNEIEEFCRKNKLKLKE